MMTHACGLTHPSQLDRGHLVMNISPGVRKSLVELFPYPSNQGGLDDHEREKRTREPGRDIRSVLVKICNHRGFPWHALTLENSHECTLPLELDCCSLVASRSSRALERATRAHP